MSDERQTRLEELLAHQQHTIDLLNAEVVDQRKVISQLSNTLLRLEKRFRALSEFVERSGEDLPHEKPPHY